MPTITFEGIDEYAKKLNQYAEHAEGLCKAAVYDGAAVVHKAILEEIDQIPRWSGFTEEMSQGLKDSCGFAKMEASGGSINTKIGFDGYNPKKTKGYPSGIPNALLARSTVRGTSFRYKNDFVGRAVRRSKEQAVEAMKKKIDEMTENMMK